MTFSEENYLKSIYTLQKEHPKGVSTNVLSKYLDTKPASATEMIKKLDEKGLVHYQPYQGVILKDSGAVSALKVIRKHRCGKLFWLINSISVGTRFTMSPSSWSISNRIN